MKPFTIFAIALLSFGALTAQENKITLITNYGSKNKEIHDMLRFQDIEVINLNFKGESLKGLNYRILIKEFLNGKLFQTDTLIDSKADTYLTPIEKANFDFKFYVKTQLNNKIKMESQFSSFSTRKTYNIVPTQDKYALHDFVTGSELDIEKNKPTYIMGYFLPYLDKETGWKKYCDVAGSKYNPEDWGTKFNIPNYFLIEILFN